MHSLGTGDSDSFFFLRVQEGNQGIKAIYSSFILIAEIIEILTSSHLWYLFSINREASLILCTNKLITLN